MRAFVLAAALAVAGCLGGDFSNDAGAGGPPDLSIPIFDLAGVDLYGAYNCTALNACEAACTTAVCVFNCRKMATPTSTFEEIELQACFDQYCPSQSAGGGAGVCAANDMGGHSAACTTCIDNTYVAAGMSCDNKAPECHKCLTQAQTCNADP